MLENILLEKGFCGGTRDYDHIILSAKGQSSLTESRFVLWGFLIAHANINISKLPKILKGG